MSGPGPWAVVPDGEGAYLCRVEPEERAVLLDVVDGVAALLLADAAGEAGAPAPHDPDAHPLDRLRLGGPPVAAPLDPAVHRLLPDASADDPEVTAEFRRLTEADLRATKAGQLAVLRAALDGARPVMAIGPGDAPRIAAALTDVRLVLADRLGLRDDGDAEALYRGIARGETAAGEEARTRRFLGTVYVALSMLQESLVDVLLDALPDGDEDGDDGGRPAGRG